MCATSCGVGEGEPDGIKTNLVLVPRPFGDGLEGLTSGGKITSVSWPSQFLERV